MMEITFNTEQNGKYTRIKRERKVSQHDNINWAIERNGMGRDKNKGYKNSV